MVCFCLGQAKEYCFHFQNPSNKWCPLWVPILGPMLLNNFINDVLGLMAGQGTMFLNCKRVDLDLGRKTHFMIRVVRHRNMLPRAVVATPHLEVSSPGWMVL